MVIIRSLLCAVIVLGLRTKQSDNFYESVEVADGDGISNINPDDIESMRSEGTRLNSVTIESRMPSSA